jgi:hypothetical protein
LGENFKDLSMSQAMLVDQIIAQPPQLFLMFVVIEMSRSVMSRSEIVSIPNAINRSASILGANIVDSWRLWPVSVYLL